jgi:hypothetical protein
MEGGKPNERDWWRFGRNSLPYAPAASGHIDDILIRPKRARA